MQMEMNRRGPYYNAVTNLVMWGTLAFVSVSVVVGAVDLVKWTAAVIGGMRP